MHFNHVYLEHDIANHPISKAILEKLPHSERIFISDYKQFFNRKNQNFTLQRRDRKLILAKQKNRFSFLGSERVRSFADKHVYSCSMIRNCQYHCEYCFLSGMHESANIVIYVNMEDFKTEIEQISSQLMQEKPKDTIYLITSYLSDLPIFEELYPFCKTWVEIADSLPNVELEIRTKSDAYAILKDVPISPKAVLVWSMSPQRVIKEYEHGTASFHARILQIKAAIRDGWRVRLCFDPILHYPQWKEEYAQCLEHITKHCSPQKIEAISFGVFRMGQTHLRKMRKLRPSLTLLRKDIEVHKGLGTYPSELREDIQSQFRDIAERFFSKEKIFFVHG